MTRRPPTAMGGISRSYNLIAPGKYFFSFPEVFRLTLAMKLLLSRSDTGAEPTATAALPRGTPSHG